MTWQYRIGHNTSDPDFDHTYGGTVPLKHLEVKSIRNDPNERREARIHHNGVPVSAHWFKVEAERQANTTAIANGLDGYYVDGQFKPVRR